MHMRSQHGHPLIEGVTVGAMSSTNRAAYDPAAPPPNWVDPRFGRYQHALERVEP